VRTCVLAAGVVPVPASQQCLHDHEGDAVGVGPGGTLEGNGHTALLLVGVAVQHTAASVQGRLLGGGECRCDGGIGRVILKHVVISLNSTTRDAKCGANQQSSGDKSVCNIESNMFVTVIVRAVVPL